MKIILSRKGFDSSSGGCPSPILPDKRLRSLPIPDCCSSAITYEPIYENDEYPTSKIVKSLTKCKDCGESKVKSSSFAHHDPDIDYDSVVRNVTRDTWRGVFGQCGASQGHLDNEGVAPGDLFLFFGLFQETAGSVENLEFVRRSKRKHIIWGWMQVGEVVDVENERNRIPSWCENHPHVSYKGSGMKNNTLYIASEQLSFGNIALPSGCGVFSTYESHSPLQLTAEGENTSIWCLPKWFDKRLSHHPNNRWSPCAEDKSKVLLDSVGRGQEFVIDLGNDTVTAVEWLQSIFACTKQH